MSKEFVVEIESVDGIYFYLGDNGWIRDRNDAVIFESLKSVLLAIEFVESTPEFFQLTIVNIS